MPFGGSKPGERRGGRKAGTPNKVTADLKAAIMGAFEAEGSGNGMIDAAVAAIASATGVEGRITDFQVHSVTGGGDALGDVVVQLESDGLKVTGRGVSTDVVEASARAYLNAVNRILRLRERGEEREIEIGP